MQPRRRRAAFPVRRRKTIHPCLSVCHAQAAQLSDELRDGKNPDSRSTTVLPPFRDRCVLQNFPAEQYYWDRLATLLRGRKIFRLFILGNRQRGRAQLKGGQIAMTNQVTPRAAPFLRAASQREGPAASGTRGRWASRVDWSLSSYRTTRFDLDGVWLLRDWPFVSSTMEWDEEPRLRPETTSVDSPVCNPAQAQKPALHPLEEDSYAAG